MFGFPGSKLFLVHSEAILGRFKDVRPPENTHLRTPGDGRLIGSVGFADGEHKRPSEARTSSVKPAGVHTSTFDPAVLR